MRKHMLWLAVLCKSLACKLSDVCTEGKDHHRARATANRNLGKVVSKVRSKVRQGSFHRLQSRKVFMFLVPSVLLRHLCGACRCEHHAAYRKSAEVFFPLPQNVVPYRKPTTPFLKESPHLLGPSSLTIESFSIYTVKCASTA